MDKYLSLWNRKFPCIIFINHFIIVDKQKTVVDGTGNNEGYFVTIIDPFDALKMQRLLVNPNANAVNPQTYDLKQKAKIDGKAWFKRYRMVLVLVVIVISAFKDPFTAILSPKEISNVISPISGVVTERAFVSASGISTLKS